MYNFKTQTKGDNSSAKTEFPARIRSAIIYGSNSVGNLLARNIIDNWRACPRHSYQPKLETHPISFLWPAFDAGARPARLTFVWNGKISEGKTQRFCYENGRPSEGKSQKFISDSCRFSAMLRDLREGSMFGAYINYALTVPECYPVLHV